MNPLLQTTTAGINAENAGAFTGRLVPRHHPSMNGEVGWVDEDDIESAGEQCPAAYSLN
jgi:hypothetical protein